VLLLLARDFLLPPIGSSGGILEFGPGHGAVAASGCLLLRMRRPRRTATEACDGLLDQTVAAAAPARRRA